jgi:hypothetical protein
MNTENDRRGRRSLSEGSESRPTKRRRTQRKAVGPKQFLDLEADSVSGGSEEGDTEDGFEDGEWH